MTSEADGSIILLGMLCFMVLEMDAIMQISDAK
jgi:hypothetical protein